ncbi:hypothetical protein LWI28_023255 [Acer negundo]|uniref:Uncharacterized protein n=1 Tax=Acer negundo TaxID=4023 RepID=A0AAD5I7V9_ACENE|nr:hypothetical protein LWI28_023255 [Acer negundo]
MKTETTVSTIKLMNQDLVRLNRFDDLDLQPLSEPTDKDSDKVKVARKKREKDELIYRGHILNPLFDKIYDLYTNTKSAKELWNALHYKYKAEEKAVVIAVATAPEVQVDSDGSHSDVISSLPTSLCSGDDTNCNEGEQ